MPSFTFIKRDSDDIITFSPGVVLPDITVDAGFTAVTVTDVEAPSPTPRVHVYDAGETAKYSTADATDESNYDKWFIGEFFSTGLKALVFAAIELASPRGSVTLDLTTPRIISSNAIQATTEGGVPDVDTEPRLERVNGATDKALRLVWSASNNTEIQPFFPYPRDIDTGSSMTIYIDAQMSGSTDTPSIAVGFFGGIGDTNAGGNTNAGGVSSDGLVKSTRAFVSRTIAAIDLAAPPSPAVITLTPGAHTTDALRVYNVWVEYERDVTWTNLTLSSSQQDAVEARAKDIYAALMA